SSMLTACASPLMPHCAPPLLPLPSPLRSPLRDPLAVAMRSGGGARCGVNPWGRSSRGRGAKASSERGLWSPTPHSRCPNPPPNATKLPAPPAPSWTCSSARISDRHCPCPIPDAPSRLAAPHRRPDAPDDGPCLARFRPSSTSTLRLLPPLQPTLTPAPTPKKQHRRDKSCVLVHCMTGKNRYEAKSECYWRTTF
ncbi:unnamed protein product, partial [Urochloa humidicola]